jgi:hypothetical protein
MTDQTPRNFLLRKPGRPFNPYANWKTYRDKEIIFHFDEIIERWDAHPTGIIIETLSGGLAIHGEGKVSRIHKEKTDFMWFGHSKGFLTRRGNRFLLNDTELVYEGEWDDWRSHPDGVG